MKIEKLKVATVVGTRPEIIRLSCVISELDKQCEHLLIHTGQNYDYELNEIFFDDLQLRPPVHFLGAAQQGFSAAQTIGALIARVDAVLAEAEPDALLVLGDTNSALSVIPAKRRRIPIFHMEAGNRCFDERVPEEINRRIVDHVADINLTYSTIAREYLLREGLSPDQVIKTGSPMYEVLHRYMPRVDDSEILGRLGLEAEHYFVVSAHREENIDPDRNFLRLCRLLDRLATAYNYPVIVSTHPRTAKRCKDTGISFDPLVKLMKPLAFTDYIRLQKSAAAVLSDSGTISEESSILNFPALNIREAHERPEAMEEAAVIMPGLDEQRVMQSLAIVMQQTRGEQRSFRMVTDYDVPNVSQKVVRLIHSYTDYVNRAVWKKY